MGECRPDVARSSADIGLQYERPTGADIAFAKVARLHIWPYASRKYVETYGLPRSVCELLHHRYVVQAANQLEWLKTARWRYMQTFLLGCAFGQLVQLAILMWRTWP